MLFMSLRTGDAAMAKVAVVWRGGREARKAATPQNNRFHRVFEELAAIGIHAKPPFAGSLRNLFQIVR